MSRRAVMVRAWVSASLMLGCGAEPEKHETAGQAGGRELAQERLDAARGALKSWLRPGVASEASNAHVVLPDRSPAQIRVRDPRSGTTLQIAVRGARDVSATLVDGIAVFPGGAPSGGDALWRLRPDGVEDFQQISAGSSGELVYDLTLDAGAALRLVDDVLEILDASGTPRLRMTRPLVLSADAETARARVHVDGCEVDSDPRPPWGRPVRPPGARQCGVRVSWDHLELARPVWLDPGWTTTDSMGQSRVYHTATLLSSGRVLVTGGSTCNPGCTDPPILATAELYDPATETWATTAPMQKTRQFHAAVVLQDGRALITGGYVDLVEGYTASCETYDEGTGNWTSVGNMAVGRSGHILTVMDAGQVLVAGGSNDMGATTNAQRFQPSSNTWLNNASSMGVARNNPVAVRVSGNRTLVVGGAFPLSAETFDASDGTWAATGTPSIDRGSPTLSKLDDGRVAMVAGFQAPSNVDLPTDVWDPSSGTWTLQTSTMNLGRAFTAAVTLPNGRVLVMPGAAFAFVASTEVWDPLTDSWHEAGSGAVARRNVSATLLADGRALLVGGIESPGPDRTNLAEVFELGADGEVCTLGGTCFSGFCVDGVCCDTACDRLCEGCTSALKGSGADGSCGPVADGTDPETECSDQGVASCGRDGQCDGAGACRLYAMGAPCTAQSCSGTVHTLADTCDGTGSCLDNGSESCAPYRCDGAAGDCRTSCSDDDQCTSDAFCAADNSCTPKLGTGQACKEARWCASGFCVQDTCCDSACDGTCQSCTANTKTSGPDGECGAAADGLDPQDDCVDDGAASCDRDGTCDGAGACRLYSNGTVCGETTCIGNTQVGFACDGAGTCDPGANTDCGLYQCSAGMCPTSCDDDSVCVVDAYCDEMQRECRGKGANGTPCADGRTCLSGFCVDGVCCTSSCAGQCEACDVVTAPGICTPVTGAPHGDRPSCPGADSEDPCGARICSGSESTTSCEGYVGLEVECRPASCAGGVETRRARCNGTGVCPDSKTRQCEPFVCSETSCLESCSTDDDCVDDTRCDAASGRCVTGGSCDGNYTITFPEGRVEICAPYRCDAAGNCINACNETSDCIDGYVCDTALGQGTCVVPTAAASESSQDAGCGCSVPNSSRLPRPWWLLLPLIVGASRRMRRSRQSTGSMAT